MKFLKGQFTFENREINKKYIKVYQKKYNIKKQNLMTNFEYEKDTVNVEKFMRK